MDIDLYSEMILFCDTAILGRPDGQINGCTCWQRLLRGGAEGAVWKPGKKATLSMNWDEWGEAK